MDSDDMFREYKALVDSERQRLLGELALARNERDELASENKSLWAAAGHLRAAHGVYHGADYQLCDQDGGLMNEVTDLADKAAAAADELLGGLVPLVKAS